MKDKSKKFIFTVPREKEGEWLFYRKILAEFNIQATERIWDLIEQDIDHFIEIAKLTLEGEKKNE
jgi:hypothetical protein